MGRVAIIRPWFGYSGKCVSTSHNIEIVESNPETQLDKNKNNIIP